MEKIIIPHYNTENFNYYFTKRLIDIMGSVLLIILLSPLYFLISLTIYFCSGLPIFFSWKIIGFKGKPLSSWKFRTMIQDADNYKQDLLDNNEMEGPIFKIKDDPRILRRDVADATARKAR
jgi:lipopolysaccharide/colanic/teichoic acid biosynthesis glycosyltransferase